MGSKSDCGIVTELRKYGYSVLPTPRCVNLQGDKFELGQRVKLVTDINSNNAAVRTLTEALRQECCLDIVDTDDCSATISLAVRSGAVSTDAAKGIDTQAYILSMKPGHVEITGNSDAGLFYGVQTLLQLLEGDGRRRGVLPAGEIVDWPQYELRIVHWDTKHHQDHIDTLERYLDWCAKFKINAVAFELEDKFEYPSHPIIGAPGAFTTEQLQQLVNYGLERHIQIIPNVQAPAHLAYVLKHEEFAHLRCDESNYQICMDEPEARQLIFDMYDDVCKATQGVEYFHVSTDEVYYAGICEKFRKPYNPENRSLTLVDFINAAHKFLAERGRRIIIWLEFPILPHHIKLLSPDIIDGILSPGKDAAFVEAAKAHGVNQLAYCPLQGSEKLFPNYSGYWENGNSYKSGRLEDIVEATATRNTERGLPLGTFAAAWSDAGLHNETFWLGWAMMAQGSWSPERAVIDQSVAEFMDIYYGADVDDMAEIYRELQMCARFWESSWVRQSSKVRSPVYGSSYGKRSYQPKDFTLIPPALPEGPELKAAASFAELNKNSLSQLPEQIAMNDRVIGRLQANIPRADRNRYNLEVFLSIAYLQRNHLNMLAALTRVEVTLSQASQAHSESDPSRAVGLMLDADLVVEKILTELYRTYDRLNNVWLKSRHPSGRTVEGREFVHVFDDVKDHFADRRTDFSHMIAPAESIDLPTWRRSLRGVIEEYCKANDVPLEKLKEALMDD